MIVGAPADGVLQVNDEILQVDGQQVENPDDVREVLQGFEPGTEVDFLIEREGEEQELVVPTGEGDVPSGETEGPTIIGVFLASDFELPYDITIDAGNVGGPSAGLMFSLALYDTITPGELTGGLEFAGTGTISSSGEVGPIGGIAQKMIGADRAGAEYFLAPAGNCEEVVGNEPEGLAVARIETFEQARELVEALGAGEDVEIPAC